MTRTTVPDRPVSSLPGFVEDAGTDATVMNGGPRVELRRNRGARALGAVALLGALVAALADEQSTDRETTR